MEIKFSMPEKILCDIGNTKLKLLNGSGNSLEVYNNNITNSVSKILKFIEQSKNIFVSSVNDNIFKYFSILAENKKIIDAENLLKYSNIDFSNIAKMGIDRKIGAIAALQISNPPLLSISCGTAITTTLIDDKLICRGGSISAGIANQREALNNINPILSYDDTKYINSPFGTNTNDAVHAGIKYGLIYFVLGLIEEAKNKFKFDNLIIVVSGGDSETIYNTLLGKVESLFLQEKAVLIGLEILSKRYLEENG